MIDMVWATVFIFRKGKKAKRIFDMVKYVKQWYPYFNELYRIQSKNLRNDYVFAIALQHINGFSGYPTFPFALATLPPDCEVIKMNDEGIAWKFNNDINFVKHQDVHVLCKEMSNV